MSAVPVEHPARPSTADGDGQRATIRAGEGDLGALAAALAAALADAFHDDPVFAWLIPPAAARRRVRLRRFFMLELRHVVYPVGRIHADARLTGAVLELPPGHWRMPLTAQARHGAAFARVFGPRLPHALALITWMEQRHLREPHLYVAYVGVAAAGQGRGLGSALMRATLDRADRERLPVYLEATCERNAELYARLGFELIGELRCMGSPPLRLMRRPPPAG